MIEEKAEEYLIRFWQKNNIVDILPIKTAWDLRCLLIDVIKYVLAEGRKENDELKAELQNYADVINRLMGTQLTDAEEIGRLIAIAQYGNWSEL